VTQQKAKKRYSRKKKQVPREAFKPELTSLGMKLSEAYSIVKDKQAEI